MEEGGEDGGWGAREAQGNQSFGDDGLGEQRQWGRDGDVQGRTLAQRASGQRGRQALASAGWSSPGLHPP